MTLPPPPPACLNACDGEAVVVVVVACRAPSEREEKTTTLRFFHRRASAYMHARINIEQLKAESDITAGSTEKAGGAVVFQGGKEEKKQKSDIRSLT